MQQTLYYDESIEYINPEKNSSFLWPKKDFKCEVNKMCENSPFLFFHAMSELSKLFTLKTLSLPMQFYI